jgi:hypothetical protein
MFTTWRMMLGCCALAAATLAPIARATADAPPAGNRLLMDDSLAGWEHGATAPANWIISQGRLTGHAESTPLLSGWTVGDFDLRFNWSVRDGGLWTLGLPDVPNGAGLQIAFSEGDGAGAIREGEKVLAGGAKVDAAADGKMHTAEVRRAGSRLTVLVDNRVVSEIELDRNRRFGLSLAVPKGEASLDDLRLEEPRGNSLFNGRDLVGWHVNNNKGQWTVDNGHIIPTFHTGLHYLRTDREYANYTWTFEYTISKGGNSGVAIRTAPGGWPSGDGMEMQILDRPGLVKDSTMAIYGNLPPLTRADKSGEWNRVVIKADGRMISAWVNGELVQQANTARLPEIKHRHLKGWLGLQDHGGKVRFREIYVQEAPDGLGLDAWNAPAKESGAYVVLDRLMNTERLSRADGITSGVVTAKTPKGGEHVLAELAGPGALVRCWQEYAGGRLKFYFDGELTPRIDCAAEHLADHVPSVAHQAQPALMCLPYAKSLKVVVTDPQDVRYQLNYVTFPADTPVESYSVERPGIPRGLLEAITYRHDGLQGGKLREAEIYERIQVEPQTIAPGTTVELAKLGGAGLVNWLRLHAAAEALNSNDLWIEVTVDGESVPAIAAPARFLFPAFVGGKTSSFNTMVQTQLDGYANLLAMPYGNGLTVAARNRGERPIEKVGFSMSVDRATDANRAEYAGRARLRGIFQPAGAASEELINEHGSGRWVGFVYEQPEGAPIGIASLTVDGKEVDGWAMEDLDPLWGRPGEGENYYTALSGHRGALGWRFLVLEPVSFQNSLVLKPTGENIGGRLALFYLK